MKELLKTGFDSLDEGLKARKTGRNYFKIKDGEVATVRFLQELDESSENYDEELGLGTLATWATPPENKVEKAWTHKYIVPDELEDDVSDWDYSTRFLINMLVITDDGEEVYFWDASKQVARTLIEYAREEGTLTDRLYKVKRSGAGTDTTYIFTPKAPDGGVDLKKYADDITTPEDYLRVLDKSALNELMGEQSDTDAGSWT